MKTLFLFIQFIVFSLSCSAQLNIKYILHSDMSYAMIVENVLDEELLTYKFDDFTPLHLEEKRNGAYLEVKLNLLRAIDSIQPENMKKNDICRVLSPYEKLEFNRNLRLAVQDWNWDSDSVKYVIFEYNVPFVILSSGKKGIYHQVDTLKLYEIKPEFSRIPVDWQVSSCVKDGYLYSDITNMMNFVVQLRLTTDSELVVRSTAFIHSFDGHKWTFTTTAGIFDERSKRISATYSPKETKKYCTQIEYPDKLKGLFFIQYRLLYFVPSTFTYGESRREVVFSMNPLKDQDENDVEGIHIEVDKIPEFPEGEEALSAYFKKEIINLKGERGRGKVKVVVEKDGTVSFPCVIERDIYSFDENVLPAVLRMPKWIPAYVNGEPVRAFHDIVVEF